MNTAQLIAALQRENPSGDMQVKVSTHPLDETGADIGGIIVQEYDDGSLEYEIVLMGNYQ